jgi:hypothetical protein
MRTTALHFSLAMLAGALAAHLAGAVPFFSVDALSPSVPGVNESDILMPGPVGGPPIVVQPAALRGLAGAGVDDLDAITAAPFGTILGALHISVDRLSPGTLPPPPPDVGSEAAAGQQAGDIYTVGALPLQSLAWNQTILGLLPPVPPGFIAIPPIDDVDALDLGSPGPTPVAATLWSLTVGHPYLGASGLIGCGGDLFLGFGGPFIAFGAGGLGLLACIDEVDALQWDAATGSVLFSLAPGSPSLAPGSPIVGCGLGCTGADVFIWPFPGPAPSALAIPAAALGLGPLDNVDAIAFQPAACPAAVGDLDLDGIDDSCDNCLLAAAPNPDQTDTDVDGYGNRCDADYDQNGVTGGADFNAFRLAFGSPLGAPGYLSWIDMTSPAGGAPDGVIGGPDFGFVFLPEFGTPPGPSGLACAGIPPCTH